MISKLMSPQASRPKGGSANMAEPVTSSKAHRKSRHAVGLGAHLGWFRRYSILLATLAVGLGVTFGLLSSARAEEPAPAAAATAQAAPPTAEELAGRVADLEAYVTNGVPKKLVSSGPGHNAWM